MQQSSDTLDRPQMQSVLNDLKNQALQKQKKRSTHKELEGTLVSQAKTGDKKAFRTLVEKNQGRLFGLAFGMLRNREDALDAVQDSFVKAHRKLTDFDEKAAFATWIYRICVNTCLDKKRSQKRKRQNDHMNTDVHELELSHDAVRDSGGLSSTWGGKSPFEFMDNKDLAKTIGQALDLLSDEHKSVLLLREVEGMNYDEIAETLSVARGTVMSRLFHARKKMQVYLKDVWNKSSFSEAG